jgi:hypothetical protein
MIIQLLITLFLLIIFIYAYLQKQKSGIVFYLLTGFIAIGVYLLWHPSSATDLANLLGIGRGADLLLYTWVSISFLILFNIHNKLRELMELTTLMARRIAILEATLARQNSHK